MKNRQTNMLLITEKLHEMPDSVLFLLPKTIKINFVNAEC